MGNAMNNRRSFYRILHVQPEAPFEVIKASYRCLMTKLKAHPDLGGNHELAVLINKAYAILSDPKRRRQYDEMLHLYKKRIFAQDFYAEASETRHQCFFCGAAQLSLTNNYCISCVSPLSPAKPIPYKSLAELSGRRAAPRIAKSGILIIYPSWPHAGYPARMRDLSPTGISLLTSYGARVGQKLKFDSHKLKGVASIVSVRPNGANFSVHAAILSVEFEVKSGVFVTEQA
jgi:curved DNA-binding protein CbpA